MSSVIRSMKKSFLIEDILRPFAPIEAVNERLNSFIESETSIGLRAFYQQTSVWPSIAVAAAAASCISCINTVSPAQRHWPTNFFDSYSVAINGQHEQIRSQSVDNDQPLNCSASPSPVSSIEDTTQEEDGGDSCSQRKVRRNRTVFTELQLMGLERRFDSQKYLSTPDRAELARALGLTQLQVKTWYQNRRMKWKKQVMQNGCPIPPTKPKGRPKKNSIPSLGMNLDTALLTNPSLNLLQASSKSSSHLSNLCSQSTFAQ